MSFYVSISDAVFLATSPSIFDHKDGLHTFLMYPFLFNYSILLVLRLLHWRIRAGVFLS